MGGIGWAQLLIIAVIVILLFGTKKLRNMGSDLGGAIKGFKKAMQEEDEKPSPDVEKKTDKDLKKAQSDKPESKQKDQD